MKGLLNTPQFDRARIPPTSEHDPLLPQNPTAPEVSGDGFERPIVNNATEERSMDKLSTQICSITAAPRYMILAIFTFIFGLGILITHWIPGGPGDSWEISKKDCLNFKARTQRILSQTPLIDGHNDFAIVIRYLYQNKIDDFNFTHSFENGTLPFQVDLPRLKIGNVGGSFWSAYTHCPLHNQEFSDSGYGPAVTRTLQQIDVLRRLIAKYPNVFSPPDIDRTKTLSIFKDKKIISPLAIEGLHQIGNSFAILRLYRSLGVRYATLTHNCHNAFADSALVVNQKGDLAKSSPYWNGLSERGKLAVKEMNRIGMLVDLSHVSKDTMMDVLGGRPEKFDGSLAPVMFSHSSAYALCPHPRNVPDDVLELVKRRNSIVMVNFSPLFISCVASGQNGALPDFYEPNSTLHQVARHITYIGNRIGYDHVGIGSDFDGIQHVPKGLEDVSKFPELVAELLKMGVSDLDAAKIIGKNILRVWADADKVAAKMQEAGERPADDSDNGPWTATLL